MRTQRKIIIITCLIFILIILFYLFWISKNNCILIQKEDGEKICFNYRKYKIEKYLFYTNIKEIFYEKNSPLWKLVFDEKFLALYDSKIWSYPKNFKPITENYKEFILWYPNDRWIIFLWNSNIPKFNWQESIYIDFLWKKRWEEFIEFIEIKLSKWAKILWYN